MTQSSSSTASTEVLLNKIHLFRSYASKLGVLVGYHV